MVTDTAMGSSVVRSSGPGIVLSGWKGCEFAGLEVCCFFFGFFWIFLFGRCILELGGWCWFREHGTGLALVEVSGFFLELLLVF